MNSSSINSRANVPASYRAPSVGATRQAEPSPPLPPLPSHLPTLEAPSDPVDSVDIDWIEAQMESMKRKDRPTKFEHYICSEGPNPLCQDGRFFY